MNSKVVLYEHGCANCLKLKERLDAKNIQYEDVTDLEIMRSKGFVYAPMLDVDGKIMGYKEAIKWIGEQ